MIRYRSEAPFGEGYRDVVPVMVHEIYEMGNVDILETLISGIYDIPEGLVEDCREIIEDKIESSEDGVTKLCEKLIREISRNVGHEIKYCLWLADKQVVEDFYCAREEVFDIDAYETGNILSDCGYDGCLYGYKSLPQPLDV